MSTNRETWTRVPVVSRNTRYSSQCSDTSSQRQGESRPVCPQRTVFFRPPSLHPRRVRTSKQLDYIQPPG